MSVEFKHLDLSDGRTKTYKLFEENNYWTGEQYHGTALSSINSINQSIDFSGTSSYAKVSDTSFQPTDFTFEFLMKPDAWVADGTIQNLVSRYQGGRGWYIRKHGSTTPYVTLWFWDTFYPSVYSSVTIDVTGLEGWHHIAFVHNYTAHTLTSYLDGVQQNQTTGCTGYPWARNYTFLGTRDSDNTGTPLGDSGSEIYYEGALDEVRLWSVARSGADILANMQTEIDPATSGLYNYWKCNSISGGLIDETTTGKDMTVYNLTLNDPETAPRKYPFNDEDSTTSGDFVQFDTNGNLVSSGVQSSDVLVNPINILTFDTTYTEVGDEPVGSIYWNPDEETFNGVLPDGVILQFGQELPFPVKNQTGSDITDGTPVMFAGAVGASGRLLVQPAIADGTYPPAYTIGLVTQTIANGEDGKVTWFGKVRGLNTTGSLYGETWADGDVLYISDATAGYLTKVPPSAPSHRIPVCAVEYAHATNGTLLVRPTWYGTMSDLSDVNGTTPDATNKFLLWDNSNSYWDAGQPSHNDLTDIGSFTHAQLDAIINDTFEPTGFLNQTDQELSWVDATRTLTISPSTTSFSFYVGGTKYTKSSGESIQITDVDGLHVIVYDSSGSLVAHAPSSFDSETIIIDNAFVALVLWNSTLGEGLWGQETHMLMNPMTHLNLHTFQRSQAIGGTLSGFTIGDGSLDSHSQFDGDAGTLVDEDIWMSIPALAGGTDECITLYKTGATPTWAWQKKTGSFWVNGTTYTQYNEESGGTWGLTEAGNNDYVLMHLLYTNFFGGRTVAILGEQAYQNVSSAREGAITEVNNILTTGLPMLEFVVLGTVIGKTSSFANSDNVAIVQSDPSTSENYVPFIQLNLSAGSSATDHNLLSGRSTAESHPASAISTDTTNFDQLLSSTDTDVQTALETINDNVPAEGAEYTSRTINVDNTMTTAEIQAEIDSIGKYLHDGVYITIQFADGTYTMTDTLYFRGFRGGGSVLVYGNASDNSLSETKSVKLSWTTEQYGIYVEKCNDVFIERMELYRDDTSATGTIQLCRFYACQRGTLRNCYLNSSGKNGTQIALGASVITGLTITNNYIKNHDYGIYLTGGCQAYTTNCASNATSKPDYGYTVLQGALLGIDSGTTMVTGAVQDHNATSGGVITYAFDSSVEHNTDGTHSDITADSIHSSSYVATRVTTPTKSAHFGLSSAIDSLRLERTDTTLKVADFRLTGSNGGTLELLVDSIRILSIDYQGMYLGGQNLSIGHVEKGFLTLHNNNFIGAYNNAGTDDFYVLGVNTSDELVFGNSFLKFNNTSGDALFSSIVEHKYAGVHAQRITSAQTISASTDTVIILNNTYKDVNSLYNTTTGVWTAPADGYLKVFGDIAVRRSVNSQIRLRLKKNTSTYVCNKYMYGGTSNELIPFHGGIDVSSGDTVSLMGYCTATFDVDGNAQHQSDMFFEFYPE